MVLKLQMIGVYYICNTLLLYVIFLFVFDLAKHILTRISSSASTTLGNSLFCQFRRDEKHRFKKCMVSFDPYLREKVFIPTTNGNT